MKLVFATSAIVLVAIQGSLALWKPPGQYDLSMGEIVPLCKMVKKFSETGQPPEPEPFDVEAGDDQDKCIYFSWTSCSKPSNNPNRPCGWYEMKKCGGGRKKRSFTEYIERIKREASQPDGPVILGFPDDEEDFPAIHAL